MGIEIESDLPVQEALDEFQQNSDYTFRNTANVKVIDTNWYDSAIMSHQNIDHINNPKNQKDDRN